MSCVAESLLRKWLVHEYLAPVVGVSQSGSWLVASLEAFCPKWGWTGVDGPGLKEGKC